MNKQVLTFIMGLMGLSIIGIIIIQMVWINNAINVKNELVEKSIVDALSESAQDIEDLRSRRIFVNFASTNDFSWEDFNSPRRDGTMFNFFPEMNRFEQRSNRSNNRGQNRQEEEREDEDTVTNNEFTSEQDSLIMRTQNMFRSGMARIDSLTKLANSLRIMTPEIQDQFDYQREKLEDVTNQIISEYNSINNNLVTVDEMHSIVQNELADKDIELDFDLAVFSRDSIIALTANADSLNLKESRFRRHLFSRNFFERDQSIAIHLPEQSDYVYNSVFWLLFASLLFSLIVLLTFGLSIYFMLKQKKISEMKSDFINNMTHEFKTPIATISVAADTIGNSKVINQPEKISYFLEMIKKENTRMNRQVEDILAIARLDKKEFEFKWEPVNIHDTIEDVVESIILQVESKGGTINADLKASNPTIVTDKNHCANLIYNLLDNANKYTPENPQLKVKTRNTNNGIIISIEDNGIGMSKSVQSKIFERFYRQTSGNIHNVKGFGLGLSYTKAVIEANKGSISVQSEPGKGSRFDVFLPFTREN